jgi:hypothetical protein
MSGILQVLYSCHGCGLKDVAVTVAHRKQGENITTWVDKVRLWVSNDHTVRSPKCTERKCDLKIPMQDGEGIGFVPAKDSTL